MAPVFRSRCLQNVIVVVLVTCALSTVPSAWADDCESEYQQLFDFSVKAQPLGSAIIELSLQGDLTIGVRNDLIRNYFAPALQGRYTVTEALNLLLIDTPLHYEAVACKHFTIQQRLLPLAQAVATSGELKPPLMEELIIVGTPGGIGINKLKASFSVTTIEGALIDTVSPDSAADLFTLIPGVWSENSGGVGNANIFVRGLPTMGDAQFVTLQLEGLPLFTPPTLPFLENSALFRLDETIERMEALRGGPSPVFSNGQPGLTTNFILREGGEGNEGLIKYSVSDYHQERIDLRVSGKLIDDLYVMIGGYKKSSPSIRDTGFIAERGKQWTFHLSRLFEFGKVNIYSRTTDDYGPWFLSVPLHVPGVDAGSYIHLNNATRYRSLEMGTSGNIKTFDFGEGRGFDGRVTGVGLELDVGAGWSIRNGTNYLTGDADTLGVVPLGSVITVSDLLGGAAVNGAVSGNTLAASRYLQPVGWWVVRKSISSLNNDLSISKSWAKNTLTWGYYYSHYSVQDNWNLSNNEAAVVVGGTGEPVNVTCRQFASAAIATQRNSPQCGRFILDAKENAGVNATYIAHSLTTGAWVVDAGVRYERYHSHNVGYSDFIAADGLPSADISRVEVEYETGNSAFTLGLHYELSDDMGVFVRMNKGHEYADSNEIKLDKLSKIAIDQFELGYKLMARQVKLFSTFYYNEVTNSMLQRTGINSDSYDSRAYGLELDFQLTSRSGVGASLIATFQNASLHSADHQGYKGNDLPRQPRSQIHFRPFYEFQSSVLSGSMYGAYMWVSSRYADLENSQKIDGFSKLDLGVITHVNDRLRVQLAINNLTDVRGLTEGNHEVNARMSYGRTILARSVRLSIAYNF